jgi:hypothetical protein
MCLFIRLLKRVAGDFLKIAWRLFKLPSCSRLHYLFVQYHSPWQEKDLLLDPVLFAAGESETHAVQKPADGFGSLVEVGYVSVLTDGFMHDISPAGILRFNYL